MSIASRPVPPIKAVPVATLPPRSRGTGSEAAAPAPFDFTAAMRRVEHEVYDAA